MAIRLQFDPSHNVYPPTFVLANRNGHKLGSIPATGIHFKHSLVSYADLAFKVHKESNGKKYPNWNKVTDFKLAWCKEWDTWFEIAVELDESNELVKNVTAKSLGEAELSQINIHGIEINTEADILRDDYEPTTLYNSLNPNASLLNRIMEKAPHYRIKRVDARIAGIQRTFTFDGVSIYDAFQTIAQEINCIFIIDSGSDENGKPCREISVYDLESYCMDCGKRNDFVHTCPECGSTNTLPGYGKDTTIFLSTDTLADNIVYTTDTGAVKNCFKLVAGDDLMTATLVNCNPNGSGYIWYISDSVKEDMTDSLVSRLEDYDKDYNRYLKEYTVEISPALLQQYNKLVENYSKYSDDLELIPEKLVGYPALMNALYNTIDLELFLKHGLMPKVDISETSASAEKNKINTVNIPRIAVSNTDVCSAATISNAVRGFAKTFIDSRYRVSVEEGEWNKSSGIWNGGISISNYSNEEDASRIETISFPVTDNYKDFVTQRITKIIHKDVDGAFDHTIVTDTSNAQNFKNDVNEFSLAGLESLQKCIQTCIDVLIEQGAASGANGELGDMYNTFRSELAIVEKEIEERKSEIAIVTGTYDSSGLLKSDGVQSILDRQRLAIQDALDFEKYLGEDLWLEFVAYRRDDVYQNDNYISDGLNNAELFSKALEFIDVAKKEIVKSATLQHSISTTLKNLLTIKGFEPIVDYFEVGNWLRIRIDDEIYRLRLLDYEINFDDLSSLSVTFSDVMSTAFGDSDIKNTLDQAASMATSYGAVTRQAEQGSNTNQIVSEWVEKGLAMTAAKLVNDADNQDWVADSHGMVFRKYDPITESYDDMQLKIINSTIAITDDGWDSVRAAIGVYYYLDPETGKLTKAYGVNGETLVGKVILGEKLGIYNSDNSMTFDRKGLVITGDKNQIRIDPSPDDSILFALSKLTKDENNAITERKDVFYVGENGSVNINIDDGGSFHLQSNDVQIQNKEGSLTFGSDGLRVTGSGDNGFRVDPNPSDGRIFAVSHAANDVLYIGDDGKVHIDSDSVQFTGSNSDMSFGGDGLTISNGTNSFVVDPNNTQLVRILYEQNPMFYTQKDGVYINSDNLKISGTTTAFSFNSSDGLIVSNSNNKFTANPNNGSALVSIAKANGNGWENIFWVDSDGVLHVNGVVGGDGKDLDIDDNSTIVNIQNQFKGVVTFTDLLDNPNNTTVINGGYISTNSLDAKSIKTDTLTANMISAGTLNADKINLVDSNVGGFIKALGSTINENGETIETVGIKMYAGSGGSETDPSSTSTHYFMVTSGGAIMKAGSNYFYVADGTIRASQSITTTSDRRQKHDIVYELDKYDDFYLALRPSSYQYNYGTDVTHTGFIAQDVHNAMICAGLNTHDFAGLSCPENESGFYSLAYEEFIALNTHMIQKLMGRISALEERMRG